MNISSDFKLVHIHLGCYSKIIEKFTEEKHVLGLGRSICERMLRYRAKIKLKNEWQIILLINELTSNRKFDSFHALAQILHTFYYRNGHLDLFLSFKHLLFQSFMKKLLLRASVL